VEPKQGQPGARAHSLLAEVVARVGAREWRVRAAEAREAEAREAEAREAEAWEAVKPVRGGRPVTDFRGQARTEAGAEATVERRGTAAVAVALDRRRVQAARTPVRPVLRAVPERRACSNAAEWYRRIRRNRAAALAAG
jgi:pilus assembly protein FimV